MEALRASCAIHDSEALAVASMADAPPLNASVSVVIGAWQRPLTLALIIAALRRQKLVQVEIVLVDAGSWPPLLQRLPGLDVDTYIYHREDGAYHRVRSFNEGVAAARNEILLLLDDDVIPASDFWAFAALSSSHKHSHASIIRLPLHILEFRADFSDALLRLSELASINWSDKWHRFPTYNIVVRKSVWLKLGGLDASFDGMYGEEDIKFHSDAERAGVWYERGPMYGCALHAGVFFGNRRTGKAIRKEKQETV
jgi:glycosyltransferase involved in cell wall biosynthesis